MPPTTTRDSVPGFGPRLRALRDLAGLSQRALAAGAGLCTDSVVKLEQGHRQPSLYAAWRLADALGVTVLDLLPAGEEPAAET